MKKPTNRHSHKSLIPKDRGASRVGDSKVFASKSFESNASGSKARASDQGVLAGAPFKSRTKPHATDKPPSSAGRTLENSSHISGKKNPLGDFFLVVPIGLEALAEQELVDWLAVLAQEYNEKAYLVQSQLVKGGIEFRLHRAVAPLLNHCLKIPSRILERIGSFETRDKKIFAAEMLKVNWKDAFPRGISKWEIAASESKLNNEKHLRVWIEENLQGTRYRSDELHGTAAYLRVHNNQFTLSRDLSGVHLHFRGYRQKQGEAPLRENLAAALWSILFKHLDPMVLAESVIVDPFVGSGTLLIEGWLWNRFIKTRSFAADHWLDSGVKKDFSRVEALLQSWNWRMVGVDTDAEVLKKAEINMAAVSMEGVQLIQENSCAPGRPDWLMDTMKTVLISNPPYGGRGRLESKDSWRGLWGQALLRYNPEVALGLGPEKDVKLMDRLHQWECVDVVRFLNGGIRVAASVWKQKNKK